MADLEHDVPFTVETISSPGSVAKQFTAAAVLLLARDGKLSLDDPARKYLPELPSAAAAITIRQMLNHTAGLRDWGTSPPWPASRGTVWRDARHGARHPEPPARSRFHAGDAVV